MTSFLDSGMRAAMTGIDEALTRTASPRIALRNAWQARCRTDAEYALIEAAYMAGRWNQSHDCNPESMRHAAERLRDAAEALAAELEAGADHAEAGDWRGAAE